MQISALSPKVVYTGKFDQVVEVRRVEKMVELASNWYSKCYRLNNESSIDPAIMKMLEELTKRIESGKKKIEVNDKKVETYNSQVDKIPGAPPILKGLDSKKFVQ